jgi:hypothetical protein
VPPAFVTVTVYTLPFWLAVVDEMVYVLDVAPEIGCPFKYHWKVKGPVP